MAFKQEENSKPFLGVESGLSTASTALLGLGLLLRRHREVDAVQHNGCQEKDAKEGHRHERLTDQACGWKLVRHGKVLSVGCEQQRVSNGRGGKRGRPKWATTVACYSGTRAPACAPPPGCSCAARPQAGPQCQSMSQASTEKKDGGEEGRALR